MVEDLEGHYPLENDLREAKNKYEICLALIDYYPMNLLHFNKNRLKQVAIRGRYHLLSVAAVITTVFYLTGFLKFYPNTVALLMTLTGLLTILIQQIFDTNKFGSHNPNTFTSWIKFFITGKPITSSARCVMSGVGSLKVHPTASIAADATIEKKIDFLLKQFASLNSDIAWLNDKLDSSLDKTEKKFQASLDTITTSLNNIIASHVVGAYDMTLFGINITICGTVIQFFK